MDIELQTVMLWITASKASTMMFLFVKMAVIYLCIALLVWLWKK